MNVLSKVKIRSRLLVAVLVPVLVTAATLAWITASQIQANGEDELKRLENSLLDRKSVV